MYLYCPAVAIMVCHVFLQEIFAASQTTLQQEYESDIRRAQKIAKQREEQVNICQTFISPVSHFSYSLPGDLFDCCLLYNRNHALLSLNNLKPRL